MANPVAYFGSSSVTKKKVYNVRRPPGGDFRRVDGHRGFDLHLAKI
jgi:hypothetical protein